MAGFLTEPLWGYIRGVRFQYIQGVNTLFDAHFETGHGKITFKPIIEWDENDDYVLMPELKGYRPYFDIDLRNYRVDEYKEFQHLFSMLTRLVHQSSDTETRSIKIYPRYTDDGDAENINYNCFIKSDVTLNDYSDFIEVMQTQKISFIGLELVNNIPTTLQYKNTIVVPDIKLGGGGDINVKDQ